MRFKAGNPACLTVLVEEPLLWLGLRETFERVLILKGEGARQIGSPRRTIESRLSKKRSGECDVSHSYPF